MRYANILKSIPLRIPQMRPLNKRQVRNDAGGFVYATDRWAQLDRFLILGAEGGTFYASQDRQVTRNYDALLACLKEDGPRTVARIKDVSVRGLAPKQDPAIFALAVAASQGDLETRSLALAAVTDVCRTASTFFQFLEELKAFRKLTGRAVKRAIETWYSERSVGQLAYQVVKYRTRAGWTHQDAIRVGHPSPGGDGQREALYRYVARGEWPSEIAKPATLVGFEAVQRAVKAKEVADLIVQYGLPREAVPTEFLKSAEVWEALLESMPLTALIRNLGNMTKIGLLAPGNAATRRVEAKLGDREYLRKSRVHPMQVLVALKTYASGRGLKGQGQWVPVSAIRAALDDSFYAAFENVSPTGKRFLVGVDVSSSMAWSGGLPGGLSACEVAAAMSMVWAATEPTCEVMGFCDRFVNLGFTRKMSLEEAISRAQQSNFGSTDCALPMLWAAETGREFDVFVVITDNETWSGQVHPSVALDRYRARYVADARQVVLATSATPFTIADPRDPLALDIVGFSADVPAVISAFVGGSSGVAEVEE